MTALNETPWGKVAPQVIAVAATDDQTRHLMSNWIEGRKGDVGSVFVAAEARGELREDAPIQQLIEMAIAVPYFKKLVAGLELNQDWLEAHVDMICSLATKQPKD